MTSNLADVPRNMPQETCCRAREDEAAEDTGKGETMADQHQDESPEDWVVCQMRCWCAPDMDEGRLYWVAPSISNVCISALISSKSDPSSR